MRKVFIMSALALAISGCASQQGGAPQVRDLSDSRRAVEEAAGSGYTVKSGDTLYGIAWQHNLDYRELAALNDIAPPYQIQPGQQIQLRRGGQGGVSRRETGGAPSGSSATSQGAVATGLSGSGASVASLGSANEQELDWLLPDESAIERNRRLTAEREAEADAAEEVAGAQETSSTVETQQSQRAQDEEVSSRADDEDETVEAAENTPPATSEPDVVAAADEPEPASQAAQAESRENDADRGSRRYTPAENIDWQWPVGGQVVGSFGEGDSITAGIDIAGEKGQPVRAAGPGIVVYAGSGVRGYGNLVLIKHNDQFLSAYAHNDGLNVSENDIVEAGEVIATMGDSDAEDVRLHFEVRKDGQPQDPLEYLPSR
ncbi:peptidoglycan DD-metalloendopeptidase family protein [Halomonas sp. Bachu 37]|uniref:peptidoglycan DD-metalloendopeptidase family protein n=1 Tax=Halomonas kashgarensis TaxID=3084920 RepID=UPI003216890F